MLEEILVCPVCHGELPLGEIRGKGRGSCISCGRGFAYHDGIYDLTPIPPPDEDVLVKWALWEKLQENGLISYQMVPEASCSIAGRADVADWKHFLNLRPGSRVLDIGCGTIDTPEYLKGWPGVEAVGIDPLQPAATQSGMAFVKGIGEYLPFRAASFDSIILATSLDHVLSPQRVLSEVKRCLSPVGNVLIWFSQQAEVSPSPPSRINSIISRVLSQVRALCPMNEAKQMPKPLWQEINESLEVPEGAIDPYHFQHDNEAELQGWCIALGFETERRTVYAQQNVFLELRLQGNSS